MTRKFHTEKHFKKRHFIKQEKIHSKEKTASIKPEKTSVIDEKTESIHKIIAEPAEQTSKIKTTSSTEISPTPPQRPAMAQQTFYFAKNKTALEKLNDKFQQLKTHIQCFIHSITKK